MVERRRSVRVACELATSYRDMNPQKPVQIENAIVKNISRGGVRLLVNDFIPTTARLHIYLHLSRYQTIEVRVQPTWVTEIPHLNRYEVGASFVELSENNESAVETYQQHAVMEKLR